MKTEKKNFVSHEEKEEFCVSLCRPDIIHCHDWPTAPVCYGDKGPSKSVFTIHNLNFGADLIGRAMQAAQVSVPGSSGVLVTVSTMCMPCCCYFVALVGN